MNLRPAATVVAIALSSAGCLMVTSAVNPQSYVAGGDLHALLVAGLAEQQAMQGTVAIASAGANASSQSAASGVHVSPPPGMIGMVGDPVPASQVPADSPTVAQADSHDSSDSDTDPRRPAVPNDSASRFNAANCPASPPGIWDHLGGPAMARSCPRGIWVVGHGVRPSCRPSLAARENARLAVQQARAEVTARPPVLPAFATDDSADPTNLAADHDRSNPTPNDDPSNAAPDHDPSNDAPNQHPTNSAANRAPTPLVAGHPLNAIAQRDPRDPANAVANAPAPPRHRRQRNARERRALDALVRSVPAGSQAARRLASAVDIAGEDLADDAPHFYNIPIVGRSIAIIVDVSYSMNEPDPRSGETVSGDRASKLDVLRVELAQLLGALPTGTSVTLLAFSTDTHVLWNQPRVLDDTALDEAVRWIAALRPEDETHPVAAVRSANAMGADQIILLTDGRPTYANAEEPQLLMLADTIARRHSRLDAVGIGPDQNGSFLDTMTARARGVAAHR